MFTIYSKPACTYCEMAKNLLKSKNMQFEELILDVGQPKKEDKNYVTVNQMREVVPNAQTVPQILVEGKLLGGYQALQQYLGGA